MQVKMGSACCVAAKDRTITHGSSTDAMPRNIRYSPSWSVRWDNRRRVAGEEISLSRSFDGVGTNDMVDSKSQTTVGTAYASEEGSPLSSFRNLTWQKPSPFEGYTVPRSDQSVSKKISEAKGSMEAQLASEPSSTKMSPSTHSISSMSAPPSSSLPPSRSNSQIPGMKSPNLSISEEGSPFTHPGWSNESTRGSYGGSSDSWSVPAFNEQMNRSNSRVSSSPSIDTETCGVCSKLLTEKSYWGSQKIITTNELGVVAILICGHVYHAECLENITSEINKYDPVCPVCTYGEKQAFKLSEKALKADMKLKAKINKKSRKRVVDGDLNDDVFTSDRNKSGRIDKLSSSSSMKTVGNGKPFLKRHFSFGSNKGSRSLSENNYSWKKGYFWAKSSKELPLLI